MHKTHKPVRVAFTLLETIIALILISALMVVVWSLLANLTRVENRSRKSIANLDITRAIHRQLQDDMDRLLFFSSPVGADVSDRVVASVQPLGDESPNFDFEHQLDSTTSMPPFFYGSRDRIQFLIIGGHLLSLSGAELDVSGVTPYFVVTYEWRFPEDEPTDAKAFSPDLELDNAVGNSGSGLLSEKTNRQKTWVRSVQSFVDYQHRGNNLSSVESQRLDNFESTRIDRSRSQVGPEKPVPEQLDSMEEVSEIAWRYFDGQTWRANWDSSSEGGFPVAMELSFQLKSTSPASHNTSHDADDSFLIQGNELDLGDRRLGQSGTNQRGRTTGDFRNSGYQRILIGID